jgi:hypothetical protein
MEFSLDMKDGILFGYEGWHFLWYIKDDCPLNRRFATWLSCADERRWKTRPPRQEIKTEKIGVADP